MNELTQRRRTRDTNKIWSFFVASLGLFIALVVLSGASVASRIVAKYDNAAANAVFAVGFVFAATLLYFWLLRRRSIPIIARIVIGIVPIIGIIGFFVLNRYDGVSGELVPHFTSRWKPADQSISAGKSVSLPIADSREFSTSPYYEFASIQFWGDQRDGTVAAIDLETNWETNPPEELWRIPIGLGWGSFSVAEGLAVTLEQPSGADHDVLFAVELETGKLVWASEIAGTHSNPVGGTGPRTTPSIAGQRVIVQTGTGKMVCCDLHSGQLIWQRDLIAEAGIDQATSERFITWGRSGSPLVVGDQVIVPFGGAPEAGLKTLVSMSLETGNLLWTSGNDQISYASPQLLTLDGKEQIVLVSEQIVGGYSLVDGRKLWEYPWASKSNGDANTSQVAQIDETSLLLSKGYGRGCNRISLTKRSTGDFQVVMDWENTKSLKTKLTSCVLYDEAAFGLNDGKLECVSLVTGRRNWIKGRYGHGQILLCGEHLIITSEDGELVVLAANSKEPVELAKIKVLDGVTWNIPTLAGNLILIRNGKQAVCIKLPVKKE